MKVLIGLVAIAYLVCAALPARAFAEGFPYCQPGEAPEFRNGFKVLAGELGDKMGQPVECEHADPSNGDITQQTTNGLAFYRKATNTPTFTDGFRHWALTQDGAVYWEGTSIDPPGMQASAPPASSPAPFVPGRAPQASPRPAELKEFVVSAHLGMTAFW